MEPGDKKAKEGRRAGQKHGSEEVKILAVFFFFFNFLRNISLRNQSDVMSHERHYRYPVPNMWRVQQQKHNFYQKGCKKRAKYNVCRSFLL